MTLTSGSSSRDFARVDAGCNSGAKRSNKASICRGGAGAAVPFHDASPPFRPLGATQLGVASEPQDGLRSRRAHLHTAPRPRILRRQNQEYPQRRQNRRWGARHSLLRAQLAGKDPRARKAERYGPHSSSGALLCGCRRKGRALPVPHCAPSP